MIVECSNCSTRFQLDDSRVPLSGIRVRCSRCKEAFFLEHPDASESEAIDEVATQAAQAERAPVDASADLASDVRGAPAEADEEEDWEFNDEPGSDDSDDGFDTESDEPDDEVGFDDDQIPGLGIDDLDEDAGGSDSHSGLDLAEDSSPAEEDVEFDAGDDASDFGEAADFSALADELAEEDDEEEAAAAAAFEPMAAAPAPQPTQPSEETEDVGEPEDWDFFSDDSLEEPGRVQPLDRALGRAMAAVEADYPARATSQPDPELSTGSRGGRLGAGIAQVGRLVGWSITLLLFAVGIGRGIFHIDAADAARRAVPAVVSFDAFQAEEISASWIDTVRHSRLYAVRGRLKNIDGRTRMAGPGLQVALLSRDGARVEGFVADAGVEIREDLVRELPLPTFAEFAAGATSELAATRLGPGETVEFYAFFQGVPDEAASFRVEMTGMPPLAPFEPRALAPFEPVARSETQPLGLDGAEATTSPSASPDPGSSAQTPPSPTEVLEAPPASG